MSDHGRIVTLGPLSGSRRKNPESRHDEPTRPSHAPKQWVDPERQPARSPRQRGARSDARSDGSGREDQPRSGRSARAAARGPEERLVIVPDRPYEPGERSRTAKPTLKPNWGPHAAVAAAAGTTGAQQAAGAGGSTAAATFGAAQGRVARDQLPGDERNPAAGKMTTTPAAANRQADSVASGSVSHPPPAGGASAAAGQGGPAGSMPATQYVSAVSSDVRQGSPAPRRGSPSSSQDNSGRSGRSQSEQPLPPAPVNSEQSLNQLRSLMERLHDRPTEDNINRVIDIMTLNRASMNHYLNLSMDEDDKYEELTAGAPNAHNVLRVTQELEVEMLRARRMFERYKAAHDVLAWYHDHLGRLLYVGQSEPRKFKATYDEFKSDMLTGAMARYILDENAVASWTASTPSLSRSPTPRGGRTPANSSGSDRDRGQRH